MLLELNDIYVSDLAFRCFAEQTPDFWHILSAICITVNIRVMQVVALLISIVSLLSVLCSGDRAATIPGKVAVWDATVGNNIEYNTKSTHSQHVLDHLGPIHANYDATVIFTANSMGNEESRHSVLTTSPIADSVKNSASAMVMTNVYKHGADNLRNSILSTEAMSKARSVSTEELTEMFHKNTRVSDTFEVNVNANDAAQHQALQALFSQIRTHTQSKVLFIAVDEPSADAVAPTVAGNYDRLLLQHAATDISANSLASKSHSKTTAATTSTRAATGAEFSIYYEGTYLYITPDIFTGLMTMLFMFTVALIGFSCMGEIQGMSTFYDKVPSNGREA